jgi:hypothetical protein
MSTAIPAVSAVTKPVKGNVVRSKMHPDSEALVLAITQDKRRARLHVLGTDRDIWRDVNAFTVTVNGLERCWKCGGSGLFYMGGAVVNGRYTGQTGPCFACEGKGKQDDTDRLRNHYYWRRGRIEERSSTESERFLPADTAPTVQESTLAVPARQERQARAQKGHEFPHNEGTADDRGNLVDCNQCGCLHRDDVKCPW